MTTIPWQGRKPSREVLCSRDCGLLHIAIVAVASNDDFAIARLGTDGTLDNQSDADPPIDFSVDGRQTVDFAGAGSELASRQAEGI